MVKQRSIIAMEVHSHKSDDNRSLGSQDGAATHKKFGRHSPDQLSSMDEDEAVPSMLLQYLKPVRESQTELKEQLRIIRSDMRRYQTANREELGRFQMKDWLIICFLAIALLWQWYDQRLR